MKSSINLYHPRFEPKVDYLSLSSVALVLVISAALVFVTGGAFRFLGASAQSEYHALLQQNTMLQRQVDLLQEEVSNWKPDPALIHKVDVIKQDLTKQSRLLEELRKRAPLREKGFSILLDDLAARAASDLWIESLRVTESQMDFSGEMSSPAAFPQWLQRLSDTASFSGRVFEQTSVFMQDGGLKFELKTRRNGQNSSLLEVTQ